MSETNTTILSRLLPSKSSVDSISAECENFCTNHNEIKMTEHIYGELEAGTCTTNVTIASKLHTECKAVIMQNTTLMNDVLVTGAKENVSHDVHNYRVTTVVNALALLLGSHVVEIFCLESQMGNYCDRDHTWVIIGLTFGQFHQTIDILWLSMQKKIGRSKIIKKKKDQQVSAI